MTTAETNNERATVEEFRASLRECVVDALLAGIAREDVKSGLRDLLARLERGSSLR